MTHALVAEPYSLIQVRMGALEAVFYSGNRIMRSLVSRPGGTVTSRRSRETHRHEYTRLPAALSDGLGGLSTLLGLCASPSLILSTDSVVVMEWKSKSTLIATQYRFAARCQAQAQNRHFSGS